MNFGQKTVISHFIKEGVPRIERHVEDSSGCRQLRFMNRYETVRPRAHWQLFVQSIA
jgi:hypothetical protein